MLIPTYYRMSHGYLGRPLRSQSLAALQATRSSRSSDVETHHNAASHPLSPDSRSSSRSSATSSSSVPRILHVSRGTATYQAITEDMSMSTHFRMPSRPLRSQYLAALQATRSSRSSSSSSLARSASSTTMGSQPSSPQAGSMDDEYQHGYNRSLTTSLSPSSSQGDTARHQATDAFSSTGFDLPRPSSNIVGGDKSLRGYSFEKGSRKLGGESFTYVLILQM